MPFKRRIGTKLTFMPFIFEAVTAAIREHRIVNSQVSGEEIIYKGDINLGMAVALDWGLIVPVIRNADTLSLAAVRDDGKRPRGPCPDKKIESRRSTGRHVHDYKSRSIRRTLRHSDHQSAAGRYSLRWHHRKACKGPDLTRWRRLHRDPPNGLFCIDVRSPRRRRCGCREVPGVSKRISRKRSVQRLMAQCVKKCLLFLDFVYSCSY